MNSMGSKEGKRGGGGEARRHVRTCLSVSRSIGFLMTS